MENIKVTQILLKVAVRVRPRNSQEIQANSPVCVNTRGQQVQLGNKNYNFDHVFPPQTSQVNVLVQI